MLTPQEREELRRKVPPRNWRKYWYSYIGHALLGGVLGYCTASLDVGVGLGGTAIYLVYQWLEFLRRGDTPARDVKDFGKLWFPAAAIGLGMDRWITGY